jgi:hypothetical protein
MILTNTTVFNYCNYLKFFGQNKKKYNKKITTEMKYKKLGKFSKKII